MIKSIIVFGCLILFPLYSISQKKLSLQISDTIHLTQNNASSHEINILKIENAKLENQISIATRIIEQQNSQLEQTNDLLSIFMAMLGIMLIFFPLFSYFYYKKPIDEQKNEINNIKKEAEKILGDIKGAINVVVEKKYKEFEEEKFRNALKELNGKYFNHSGIKLIRQICSTGITDEQQDGMINYLNNSINSPLVNTNSVIIYTAILGIFSKFGKNSRLDSFLSSIFKSDLSDKQPENLNRLLNSISSYLGKTTEVGKYNLIEEYLYTALRLDEEDKGVTVYYFGQILRWAFEYNKFVHKSLVNDDSFVKYLNANNLIKIFSAKWKNPEDEPNKKNYEIFGLNFDSKLRREIDNCFLT